MLKPRLLVTRFAPHAQRLANRLNEQGIFAVAQPLLTVQKTLEFADPSDIFTKTYDYIIAVSRNAVDYTNQALAGNVWPKNSYLAVGKGTQAELSRVTGQAVFVPKEKFDSEGLLALPCLAQIQNKRILILRGLGGRELLADSLTARGALVNYYQPYQRVAINLNGLLMAEQWQLKKINGIIISSVELLKRLLEVVPQGELSWLKTTTIYAPSKRITEQARLAGWSNVQVLPSMLDKQIVDYFK